MKDEIKEILEWLNDKDYYIEDFGYKFKRLSLEENEALLDYITNLQEENVVLKDIRNQAINYNKALCKIYDCGIELSNAETNLCILEDEETINILQGKSDK